MKKKFLFGMALGCSVLLLAGCGAEESGEKEGKGGKTQTSEKSGKTQTLTCTLSEEEDGMSTTMEMKFTYNKSKKEITEGSMKVSLDAGEEYAEFLKDLDLCDEYEDQEIFSTCKSSVKNGVISAELGLDLDELEKESGDDEMEFSKDMTLKELQKSITSDDDSYKCKIS